MGEDVINKYNYTIQLLLIYYVHLIFRLTISDNRCVTSYLPSLFSMITFVYSAKYPFYFIILAFHISEVFLHSISHFYWVIRYRAFDTSSTRTVTDENSYLISRGNLVNHSLESSGLHFNYGEF